MCKSSVVIGLLIVGFLGASRVAAQGYENDFEKAPVGSVPEDFLVLEGGFSVHEVEGNKFLELPGSPLESYGLLFGPTHQSGQFVEARIFGTNKGRRFPTFGVGLNGVPGFKLQINSAKKQIELLRGEAVIGSTSFQWASGKWLMLRLQLRKTADGFQLEGKAWAEGADEPKDWLIRLPVTELPPAGRAVIMGSPYSGTPIRYDDLKVGTVAK